VLEFTHRDRRAWRDVGRALGAMAGSLVLGSALALYLPVPYAGVAGVVALGGIGAGYLVWAERFLARYTDDLRRGRTGEAVGFPRAELGTAVGLERVVGRPTARSPHSRRRYPSTPDPEGEPLVPDGPGTG